ncbi:helix-turn-helix domain-containing protein [Roseateles sp. PN1]|uniref:helix-turn-helix domain-containing protein n=1 Tax=Roseateles sp. PN1 TaxID=3137372 RepID=UPI003139D27B
MDTDQAFGLALRSLRQSKKWSQERLALEADVNRNYVSLIELGRNSPSVRMLFGLCEALEILPSDLLSDVERRLLAQQRHSPTPSSASAK